MTTIFTDTPNVDDNANDGFSVRDVLPITGGAQTQIRVTFKASGSAAFKTDHCSIGISNGTSANTTATPTELTFSGGHGFSIALGTTITSDFVNFSGFTSTDKLVVIFDCNSAANSGNWQDSSTTGNSLWFKAATVSWNVAAPAGFTQSANTNGAITLIETQSAASSPVVSRITDLPPRGYVYSEWQKWADDTNTLLPTPTVLTQTLRVQKDWPNPYPVTWYRSWEEHTVLPRPTPFLPLDWPSPRPVSWYQSWTSSGNSLTAVIQAPFRQNSWPNPQPVAWYQSWVQSFQQAIPFNQLDWPLPKISQPLLQTWSQSLNIFYQSETFPFVQTDWPNPQRVVWYQDWRLNLLQNTLTPAFQFPFNQFDWPLPKTYQPIDQFWQNNLRLLPQPTPFFQNVDFPLPVVSQPIDSTWIGNLSEFLQSNTFPFHQSDYPNPYPVYWYRDYNQNLVIYLPVGIKPFNQSDWPLPETPQPIDQYWYQALVLNLPVPPPPPVQTVSSGRQVWPEELDDLTLATHKWHQRLIDAHDHKIGLEIRKAAQELGRSGGFARAESLSQKQRTNIATKAAQTRWQPKR